jgi:hypothetical protein
MTRRVLGGMHLDCRAEGLACEGFPPNVMARIPPRSAAPRKQLGCGARGCH